MAARDVVFGAGKEPKIGLVLGGLIRVFAVTSNGRQLTVRYARAGDVVGLVPFLSGSKMFGAEAMADTTLCTMSFEQIRRAVAKDTQVLLAIVEHASAWVADALFAAADTAFQSMTVRVARHLREMALRTPDGRSVAHVSHRRLADAVGTAREVVSRELRTLREQGLIETRPGRVTVVDEPALEAFTNPIARM